jgi:hypothetical protein
MLCLQDGVINNMYSGERQPFSPVDFLYGWWTVADHLAEYQQQVCVYMGCMTVMRVYYCSKQRVDSVLFMPNLPCTAWHLQTNSCEQAPLCHQSVEHSIRVE